MSADDDGVVLIAAAGGLVARETLDWSTNIEQVYYNAFSTKMYHRPGSAMTAGQRSAGLLINTRDCPSFEIRESIRAVRIFYIYLERFGS